MELELRSVDNFAHPLRILGFMKPITVVKLILVRESFIYWNGKSKFVCHSTSVLIANGV